MHAHTGPEWERFTVTPAGEKGGGGGGGGEGAGSPRPSLSSAVTNLIPPPPLFLKGRVCSSPARSFVFFLRDD